MKYRQAREIAEDVMVEILEHIDPYHVKDMIRDTVYAEHGASVPDDELTQTLVFDQFRQIIERMRRHVRGPAGTPHGNKR
jgi:hypothetical protein